MKRIDDINDKLVGLEIDIEEGMKKALYSVLNETLEGSTIEWLNVYSSYCVVRVSEMKRVNVELTGIKIPLEMVTFNKCRIKGNIKVIGKDIIRIRKGGVKND
jgi:hypothetical protein